jgi:hypothetical protein
LKVICHKASKTQREKTKFFILLAKYFFAEKTGRRFIVKKAVLGFAAQNIEPYKLWKHLQN